ncbi:hypothetical protein V2J09_024257 [Rumex salicifolius]
MNRKHGEINQIGGSVKVGSIGKISSLMSRELESSSSSSSIAPSSSRRKPQSAPVSVSCSDRTFKLRKPLDEAQKTVIRINNTKQSSQQNTRPTKSRNQARISVVGLATQTQTQQKPKGIVTEEGRGKIDEKSRASPDLQWKTRSQKISHHIPMLGSEDIMLDKTAVKRDKKAWKVNLVEVVDTNCGIPAGSLSSRLKKLSFAKLSHSII